MEIGIHNVTVAIIVAVSVIGNEAMAVPAAVYGVLMFVPAGIVAYLLSRRAEPTPLGQACRLAKPDPLDGSSNG